ncbi:MAG: hypothetical protein WB985_15740, partial [Candidatus Acidiferrales bacterium]
MQLKSENGSNSEVVPGKSRNRKPEIHMDGNGVISNDADRFKRFCSYFFSPRTHLSRGTRIASRWLCCFTCITPNSSGRFRFIDS